MRLVLISDTHNTIPLKNLFLPDGDMLIMAGDFSNVGGRIECYAFANQIQQQLPRYSAGILVTAGNHEVEFESLSLHEKKDIYGDVHYLEHEAIELAGIKFFLSCYTPTFSSGWAYNIDRGAPLAEKWAQIPDDTEILITHGPPRNVLDWAPYSKEHVGCDELAARIKRLPLLKIHAFGHVHSGYGHQIDNGLISINASICNEQYIPRNKPYVIETEPFWHIVSH